ncbi:ABC-2 type transport system permease protein [Parvibaculum indicum]|uniref:ABC transporter permease n=1 Tax=Parvibaculum indicum TaxID=562969 RepID=UPI0014249754|nr:ABC transporter permease [Parvibaculum indicum]NIJ41264.1 ABC-2 type transport system permease protein [Parvibaculum indicum]
MNEMRAIFRRELAAYFATPLAFVFIVIFLLTMGAFTFYLGGFFESDQANLSIFFSYHPWLYLFLIPAISMRLWAEERRTGSIELLLSQPVPLYAAVLGKFFAAWVFSGLALVLTFPMWLTVNYLGSPDNGVILAGYIGSFFMAGGYLAIGSCLSATTRNQVIAFVVSVAVCFLFTVSGLPIVIDFFSGWAPQTLISTIASFSFLTHFNSITQGVIDLRDIVYFGSLIAVWLIACGVVVDMKKAG